MKISVLGTGDVGKALAGGLSSKGHQVVMGTRDPAAGKLDGWLAEQTGIVVASFPAAAAASDLAILCTNWDGAGAVAEAVAGGVAGKVVIDVTNPLQFAENAPPSLSVAGDDSAGEQVQRWLPDARVVKAWNIVGHPYMIDPDLPGGPPTMFIAGDDAEAKNVVTQLLADVGWPDVVDLGAMEASRYLEGLAMVWIRTYGATGNGNHAFRLLRG